MARVDRIKDADIDYSDIPPLGDEFLTKSIESTATNEAAAYHSPGCGVLSWLKANGRGYQTRINHILRKAMESPPPRRSRSAPKKSTRSPGAKKPA